jgi:hypothetical protein
VAPLDMLFPRSWSMLIGGLQYTAYSILLLRRGGLDAFQNTSRLRPCQSSAAVRKAEAVACYGERVTPAFEDLRDAVDDLTILNAIVRDGRPWKGTVGAVS